MVRIFNKNSKQIENLQFCVCLWCAWCVCLLGSANESKVQTYAVLTTFRQQKIASAVQFEIWQLFLKLDTICDNQTFSSSLIKVVKTRQYFTGAGLWLLSSSKTILKQFPHCRVLKTNPPNIWGGGGLSQ